MAEQLTSALNERMVSAAEAITQHPDLLNISLQKGERLGFVFPIYSWGPAPVITEMIKRMQIEGNPKFCFMVATCGDDVGLSVEIMRKALSARGITLDSAHSVQMPNSYINMRGFDVDSDTVRERKLHAAPQRVAQVASDIASCTRTVDVVKGKMAWIKSRVIRPWFLRHAINDRKFTVSADVCTHCGACVRNCPLHNITLSEVGTPLWNGGCAMCLSCLHRCPTRAIQYGNATASKGRYFFNPSSLAPNSAQRSK